MTGSNVYISFFIEETDEAIAKKQFDNSMFAIIPRIGDNVNLDEIMLDNAEKRTGITLDYDYYTVKSVLYFYNSPNPNDYGAYVEIITEPHYYEEDDDINE